MKFPQESNAQNLHRALINALGLVAPNAAVTIAGQGTNSRCSINADTRSCVVHCFDNKGPEYLIEFKSEYQSLAWGRTSSQCDTIAAVKTWIEKEDAVEIRARFNFVDRQLRALESLLEEVLETCPTLSAVSAEVRHLNCDLHELWIRGADRSCRIYYYGKNLYPDAIFHWDDCRLFAFAADDFKQLAMVLKRWISDRAMPSVVQEEFPWIKMGKAARYYEEGRGVESEFVESWDHIQVFYSEMNFEPAPAIRAFVTELRQRGYDSILRAGQSMYTLILSRSRRHGLRQGQPHIAFQFRPNGMDVKTKIQDGQTLSRESIVFDDEISALLARLTREPID